MPVFLLPIIVQKIKQDTVIPRINKENSSDFTKVPFDLSAWSDNL